MNISLTPELERVVESKVSSGHYNNASEVIRDALRLLIKEDAKTMSYEEWMHREVLKGWEQAERGEVEPFNMEAIIEEVLAEEQS